MRPISIEHLPKEVEVEIPLRVKVRITEQIKNGMRDGYGYTEEELANDELVAKAIVNASLSHRLTIWQLDNITTEDTWNGVGSLRGLIRDVELVEEDE